MAKPTTRIQGTVLIKKVLGRYLVACPGREVLVCTSIEAARSVGADWATSEARQHPDEINIAKLEWEGLGPDEIGVLYNTDPK